MIVLSVAVAGSRSVALLGFGLDSLIEIGASAVVIWDLSNTGEDRQRRALHLIGWSFTAPGTYLVVQSTIVLAIGHHAEHTTLGSPGPRSPRR